MELPEDVIQIIKEFSMPMTRPDWRTLHRMPRRTYFIDYCDVKKRLLVKGTRKPIFSTENYLSIFHGISVVY